jgi:hypothetical protein
MKLLNRSEELTFDRLKIAVGDNGARVFPKVRVADTLAINGSGISDTLFKFGLMAHFDFVVSDLEYEPLFAVEFDGPLHKTSKDQQEKDRKKNEICERLHFPLLRVNSQYINTEYRGMDLLSYFINVWFLKQAFENAQAMGTVPCDEPFDPNMLFSDRRSNRQFPYWLSLEVQAEIQAMHKQGRVFDHVPSHWIGVDSQGTYRCLSWLQVERGEFLVTHTGMRRQLFPIVVSDVIEQISVFDIRKMIDDFLAKKPITTMQLDAFEKELSRYKGEYEMRSFGGFEQFN